MVYYTYIRKLDNSTTQYIGICIVINGLLIQDTNNLFKIFEGVTGDIITHNKILELNAKGEIVAQSVNRTHIQNEYNQCVVRIQTALNSLQLNYIKVPPINNSASVNGTRSFTFDTPSLDLFIVFSNCSNIIITKGANFDTSFLAAYKANLVNLQKEKDNAIQKSETLSKELARVREEKRRTKIVAILIVILLLVTVIGFNTILERDQTISNKENEITQNENVIIEKDSIIIEKNKNLSDLNVKLNIMQSINASLEEKNSMLNNSLDSISKENHMLINKNDRLNKKLELSIQENHTLIQKINQQSQNAKSASLFQSTSNESRYVRVDKHAVLWEKPNSLDKKRRAIGNSPVYIIRKYDDKFYYVKVGNDYGYLNKVWIKDDSY